MNKLNNFSGLDAETVVRAAESFGTPIYLYDEALIIARCDACLSIPAPYGLTVRYAMKANPNRTLLKIIAATGLHIDASSMNEVLRAHMAGIPYRQIMLTTQEVIEGAERELLEQMLLDGLRYNVCSLRQLDKVADFAVANGVDIGIRIHPGVGSGESATRNTGDDYSCFGIHINDFTKAIEFAAQKGIAFRHVHVHIGSGADPLMWRQNIDLEISLIEQYFPAAESVSFGGGLKEARVPGETAADVTDLGEYAAMRINEFYQKTGRKLHMEIEPGTYITANSGYAVTRVIDKKSTGRFNFIIADGGMEVNARPLIYGSEHPFYVISAGGTLLSSEFGDTGDYEAVLCGRCCENGDMQTLDKTGQAVTRKMAQPEIGDYIVIGGVGAYCSSMAPFNYNSHTQVPEVLLTRGGELKLIRRRQTIEQMLENEI